MKTMIALVGEQPVPNMLPIKHLRPDRVVLLYSSLTSPHATRLQKLLNGIDVILLEVEAYDVSDTKRKLLEHIREKSSDRLIFNGTGGTKPMLMAAYEVARQYRSELYYLRSEDKRSVLYHFGWSDEGDLTSFDPQQIEESITIEDFIQLHSDTNYTFGGYSKQSDGAAFERLIHETLLPHFDEVFSSVKLIGALEIDFIIRSGNHFGIVETKTGTADKKAIAQLHTAASREYFGTYTQRFLVQGGKWDTKSNLRELAELRGITVIEVPSYDRAAGCISTDDAEHLIQSVKGKLG